MQRVLVLLLLLSASGPAFAKDVDIAEFGGQPDGSDTAPALNAAIDAVCAGRTRTIRFGVGHYLFLSAPKVMDCGIVLYGEGMYATFLSRAYAANTGSFLHWRRIGGGARHLTIWAQSGTSGGIGIHVESSDILGAAGDQFFENINISGDGTWTLPLFLNGIAKTQAPIGVRTVTLVKVMVFNATWWAVEWWNCVGCDWYGGGVWRGLGSTQAIAVAGPYSQKNRIDADVDWNASTVWPGSLRQ